eukprot:scaffold2441_cov413-Prasinococcus_capsulatus_cf.AAC.2
MKSELRLPYRYGVEQNLGQVDFFQKATLKEVGYTTLHDSRCMCMAAEWAVSRAREQVDTGVLYLLRIESRHAYTLELTCMPCTLPKGVEVFVFPAESAGIHDSTFFFDSELHHHTRPSLDHLLKTPPIKGDSIIIEVFVAAPSGTHAHKKLLANTKIVLSRFAIAWHSVVHAYRDIWADGLAKGAYGQSAACLLQNNAKCYPEFHDEVGPISPLLHKSRGVVQILEGGAVCSGSLVNNVFEGVEGQIVLTAAVRPGRSVSGRSCHMRRKAVAVGATTDDYFCRIIHAALPPTKLCKLPLQLRNLFVFRRHWIQQRPRLWYAGSKLLYSQESDNADSALLQITSPIPYDFGVYYNGWELGKSSIPWTYSIHHPSGDYKKISIDEHAPKSKSNQWSVHWDDGITACTHTWGLYNAIGSECGQSRYCGLLVLASCCLASYSAAAGSSGSPIFNAATGRIIGQLCCGSSTCAHPHWPDSYGKTSVAYEQVLRPGLLNNEDVEFMDGTEAAVGGGPLHVAKDSFDDDLGLAQLPLASPDDLAVIAGICGGQVLDCFCDPLCTHFGDCCDGYHAACVQLPSPVPVPTTPLPPYPPLSECQLSTIAGDLNDDSVVDIRDVIVAINAIMLNSDSLCAFFRLDLNDDGVNDLIDLFGLIDIVRHY